MSVLFDYQRRRRIDLPESVLCEGKTVDSLSSLIMELHRRRSRILFTRLSAEFHALLPPAARGLLRYHGESQTAVLGGGLPERRSGSVAVVTAGTSDLRAAQEAIRTLAYLGIRSALFADLGVAGPWRLESRLPAIDRHRIIIAAAGMDAALFSVLGGRSRRPIIALPTSQGYGVATGGYAALASALASCAPGLVVVNIDNGYGAACAAARMLASRHA